MRKSTCTHVGTGEPDHTSSGWCSRTRPTFSATPLIKLAPLAVAGGKHDLVAHPLFRHPQTLAGGEHDLVAHPFSRQPQTLARRRAWRCLASLLSRTLATAGGKRPLEAVKAAHLIHAAHVRVRACFEGTCSLLPERTFCWCWTTVGKTVPRPTARQ
jgi:hypothetical protein